MRGRLDQIIQKQVQFRRILMRPETRCGLVGLAASFDGIERHSPGRPSKTNQRCFLWQARLHPRDRLIHRRKPLNDGLDRDFIQPSAGFDRLNDRANPFLEPHTSSEGIENEKNVRKEDGPVHAVSLNRLKGCFDSQRRRVAEIQEVLRPPSELHILWQMPACLSHHPDGNRVLALAIKHIQKWFKRDIGHRVLFLLQAFIALLSLLSAG